MTVDPLAALADVPPPRRTDAAFARAVADDVQARRRRSVFAWVPAVAVAGAAVLALLVPTRGPSSVDAGAMAIGDDEPLAAFEFDEGPFALPSLDGSSEQELLALDRALDARIATQRGSGRLP